MAVSQIGPVADDRILVVRVDMWNVQNLFRAGEQASSTQARAEVIGRAR
ncbi:hypothetical protein [Pseudonocardia nigra]|nr:hypothetical protein [Pseudonocardia nigra]